jgi:hypothetical protein
MLTSKFLTYPPLLVDGLLVGAGTHDIHIVHRTLVPFGMWEEIKRVGRERERERERE